MSTRLLARIKFLISVSAYQQILSNNVNVILLQVITRCDKEKWRNERIKE